MNTKNWSILGLILVLAFILTAGLPGGAQAQQNDPAVAYDTARKAHARFLGHDGSGYAYCPMGPGYGYSAPADQNYRQHASRSWNSGYQGAWCPWNSGYVYGYRGGWGCGW